MLAAKRNKAAYIVVFSLLFIFLVSMPAKPQDALEPDVSGDIMAEESETVRGKVLEIIKEDTETFQMHDDQAAVTTQTLSVEITSGDYKGETLEVENIIDERMAYNIDVSKGDNVLLFLEKDVSGNIIGAYVSEIVRDTYLFYLVVIFLAAILLIGGLKGAKAALTLGITAGAVIKILIPLILNGFNPVFAAVLVCSGVAAVTLLIIGGINKKSFSAVIGTIGGVLIAGLLAFAIGSLAKLTGLGSQEAQMLMFIPQEIDFDFRGLLFAGILIGALGAVMDVAMSVASSMNEVEQAKPHIRTAELIKSGINVGRDIMGTMSNTLILAYAGGSLPLMLLFMAYDVSFLEIINQDLIATEVVRALAGTVGLIFTVPITALIAGLIGRKILSKRSETQDV